jgi:phospholipid/cholesterol/gamma-HCH transport system permease protein
MSAPVNVTVHRDGDTLHADLQGEWSLDRQAPPFATLADAALTDSGGSASTHGVQSIKVNAAELGAWDSSLLVFLRQGQHYCETHDLAWRADALPKQINNLLALALHVGPATEAPAAPRTSPLTRLGIAGLAGWDAMHAAVTFVGDVVLGVVRVARGRVRMRWRDFGVVLQASGSGALPIVTLIAVLVGAIIAFLGVVVLARFGAGYYSSYLVGYGMLREMGPLMTGIIMAGRTGAGFAAELGSMKITEEVDAYRALGIAPIEQLVIPRVLGIFLMLPLLVLYADLVGIVGGMGVAIALLDLTPAQFVAGLLTAVTLPDALLGIFKAAVFGAVIGMAGCVKGLQTGSGAGAVGRSATSAVVTGITLIILANAVIDWLAALLKV